MLEPESVSIEIVAADPGNRAQCLQAIDKYGFRISCAGSLTEAFKEIEQRPTDAPRPSLFVLAGMGFDGVRAAVKELRSYPWTATARILVVDEALTPEQSLTLLDAGVSDCYCKSFLAPVFSARVRGALRSGG
jgi:DNA-binding response OmpR family regulator